MACRVGAEASVPGARQRPRRPSVYSPSVDVTPALVLAMWASGLAAGAAVVARWRIVGPGFAWLSGGVTLMLGIPAALHCNAVIEAICTESNESIRLEVRNGQISKSQSANYQSTDSQLLIHFPLPFARWYDDLVFT